MEWWGQPYTISPAGFPVDQLLLLALIPWIPFLFSAHPVHLLYTFPPSLFSVIEFFIFLASLWTAFLFFSLIHSSHSVSVSSFLLYLLLLLLSFTSHSLRVRRWGRRLMMVEKLWQCLIFYYHNQTASVGLYFALGCGKDGSRDCSVIIELNVYCISYKYRGTNSHPAPNRK